MKKLLEEEKITAWLLGEIPDEEASEIQRLVSQNSELEKEVAEIKSFHADLASMMADPTVALHSDQRSSIVRSTNGVIKPIIEVVQKPKKNVVTMKLIAVLALAASLMLGLWLSFDHKDQSSESVAKIAPEMKRQIALLPSIAVSSTLKKNILTPSARTSGVYAIRDEWMNHEPLQFTDQISQVIKNMPLPNERELSVIHQRDFVDAQNFPQTSLPVFAGTASWSWIQRSILENQSLPTPNMVRIEEMVNAFRFSNANRQASVGSVYFSADTISINDQSALIAIGIENRNKESQSVSLKYIAGAVKSYRLVGFGSTELDKASLMNIPANSSTTILLEIQPSNLSKSVGDIVCNVNDLAEKLSIGFVDHKKGSLDMRHLALVAQFGNWLIDQENDYNALSNEMAQLEKEIKDPVKYASIAIMRKAFSMKEKK
jgi:von Willebrand factor